MASSRSNWYSYVFLESLSPGCNLTQLIFEAFGYQAPSYGPWLAVLVLGANQYVPLPRLESETPSRAPSIHTFNIPEVLKLKTESLQRTQLQISTIYHLVHR